MIKQIISSERVPIKLWLDDIEDSALQQAKNLANLPFIFKHIALMPDSHSGYGMPIGGVMACKDGYIIPNAVGKDIGCGMTCVRTSIEDIPIDQLKRIMGKVREVIPVGFNHNDKAQDEEFMPFRRNIQEHTVVYQQYESALKQLSSLGSGNHFLEFQKDKDDNMWIMIHSGSRNLGSKVADYYDKKAQELNKHWYSSVPKEHQLAFLNVKEEFGKAYFNEMNFCVDFAKANRGLMLKKVCDVIRDEFKGMPIDFDNHYDIAHNYAAWENHFGENVLVHRKGATKAYKGEIGIIPGSQGTASYLVKGLGNVESFQSCSHGSGRKMSRTKAKEVLNLQEEIDKMDALGIVHGIRSKEDLDEAAGSYKDIFQVMANQSDLVEVLVELKPIGVIKG